MESTVTWCLLLQQTPNGHRVRLRPGLAPDPTVRDGAHIVQFLYNGTGLDPRVQAAAGDSGAFADLPAALRSRNAAR